MSYALGALSMNTNELIQSERPLDLKEMAAFWRVTTRTIQKEMKRGMPHVKIGNRCRFSISEVTEWLKRRAK